MNRNLILTAAASLSLALAAGGAQAKTCRDATGRFTACPTATKSHASSHAARKADARPDTPRSAPASRADAAPAKSGGVMDWLRRKTTAAPSATAAGRPASATVAAGPVSARCKDGSLSHSRHRSGTCAGHGGVAAWM